MRIEIWSDVVCSVLSGEEYAAEVDADIALARAFGATGVPFYVVDRAYGVSGAPPTELFLAVLEKAWAASHPEVATTRRPWGVRLRPLDGGGHQVATTRRRGGRVLFWWAQRRARPPPSPERRAS